MKWVALQGTLKRSRSGRCYFITREFQGGRRILKIHGTIHEMSGKELAVFGWLEGTLLSIERFTAIEYPKRILQPSA